MAEETVNQETTQAAEESEHGQTQSSFSQADVDRIVAERLSRERAKYGDYETLKEKAQQFDAQAEAAKSDLQKAQDDAAKAKKELEALKKANAARAARDKVAAETGVPANLLTAETEEGCRSQAKALLEWHGQQPKYPTLKDAGDTANTGRGGGKTRDNFAEWFNTALGKSE